MYMMNRLKNVSVLRILLSMMEASVFLAIFQNIGTTMTTLANTVQTSNIIILTIRNVNSALQALLFLKTINVLAALLIQNSTSTLEFVSLMKVFAN